MAANVTNPNLVTMLARALVVFRRTRVSAVSRVVRHFAAAPVAPQAAPTRPSSNPASSPAASATARPPAQAEAEAPPALDPLPENQQIVEVTSSNFQTLFASKIPSILDAWAPWCEPCKQLTPMLEAEVKKAQGVVRLLKLNVDAEKELAQALQLKNLPTVYLLQEGRAVSSFSGVPRPADLQKFMEQAIARGRMVCGEVVAPAPVHSSPEFLLKNAAKALEQENVPASAQLYSAVLTDQNAKEHHAHAMAGLAKCALAEKQPEVAADLAKQIRASHADALKKDNNLVSMLVSIELACAGGTSTDGQTIDSLTAKLVAEPNDHASRHALALKFFGAGEVESALTSALELFKRDRNWNDGAGKKLCMQIFQALGDSHPVTKAGRRRLSNLMFV